LSWLSEIPDCPLPLDDFTTSLPTAPDPETINAQLLVGLLEAKDKPTS